MTRAKKKRVKRPLQVVDGEQRGIKAPYGSTKQQDERNAGRRALHNLMYEFRVKLGDLQREHEHDLPGVVLLELSEQEDSLVRALIEDGAWGDSAESVTKTLLAEMLRKAKLSGRVL